MKLGFSANTKQHPFPVPQLLATVEAHWARTCAAKTSPSAPTPLSTTPILYRTGARPTCTSCKTYLTCSTCYPTASAASHSQSPSPSIVCPYAPACISCCCSPHESISNPHLPSNTVSSCTPSRAARRSFSRRQRRHFRFRCGCRCLFTVYFQSFILYTFHLSLPLFFRRTDGTTLPVGRGRFLDATFSSRERHSCHPAALYLARRIPAPLRIFVCTCAIPRHVRVVCGSRLRLGCRIRSRGSAT